jgi:O-acetyl-ADP-ribose deacetylase (regulator of RNase III)
MNEWTFEDMKIRLVKGNIVDLEVDAIVNAANKSLILGGGVAGAIRSSGGPTIQKECNSIGPIESGEAVLTGGGDLKARFVIHAAGPVYGEGDEDQKLTRATLNSLKIALKEKMSKIAFPAISTGIFHFPLKRCSRIMLKTAMDFVQNNPFPKEIVFCLYEDQAFSVFSQTLSDLISEESSR